ncbi:WD repeat-containing protein 3 isoform X2 [Nilaparvata lugens]|uniref:WD repeat-containing protein 3 isoform X1 n=1 Tax=Nilaparvata lugens TaxID=108931 RepID=UPI00193D7BA5|nr:WD repeat-containing protein 3 isoform X1 [Nilaparvata lugens]XP_039277699.1 WD repeat-containing protein 3 isoform X2 [Nilaparvata lugens]
MGLTKQYLRYVPSGKCNIINSPDCNLVFVPLKAIEGRFVASGASEDVIVWDLRLGEKAVVFPGEKHEVSKLAASPDKQSLAVGYTDGSVKTFNLETCENVSIFSGHKTGITCLKYDLMGHRLASGAKDTDIVIWDIVADTGLKRLSGHKGLITSVEFHQDQNVLVSSSKDSFIKLWDLISGHCFKTIAGHITEVWGLSLMRESDYIVAGSSDMELRVWEMSDDPSTKQEDKTHTLLGENELEDIPSPLHCSKAGSVLRSTRGRVLFMTSDNTGSVLAVHGPNDSVELFQFLSDAQARIKMKKRLRKEKKKATKDEETAEETQVDYSNEKPMLTDIVRRLQIIKAGGKIKSVDMVAGRGQELRVAVSLRNNSIELYSIQMQPKTAAEPECLRRIVTQGHRSEVRCVAFSSDNLALVSGSAETLKMWNRPSLACLRTVESGYALSVSFVPGDRHALVGTKQGNLQIIDIASGDLLEDIPAHTSELWTITLLPDQTGVATGGGDSTVKFWKLELVPDSTNESKAKVLSLLHTRTLKVDEPVLCVRISPNSKLIAVALLDCTVKIFFLDTFKFFLSLYGHKLPVLCMDISYDSTLIATGSSDRNVKIWGLDFGDCHKSIFAHDDSVTGLAFVPRTHYFFTCGKDGCVKEWDADNFEKILTIKSHHGEAYGLAVSSNGHFVASCGQDRVIRMYEKTDEPLVLEDEREVEREEEENATLATGQETTVPGHADLNLASRKTVTAEKSAELLIECLQVGGEYRVELKKAQQSGKAAPPVPAIMAAFGASTPNEYLLQVLLRIRTSELEEVLIFLPFTSVCELLPLLGPLLQTPQADIVCRILVFLTRVHHKSIVSNQALLKVIQKLHAVSSANITKMKDTIGVNLHGLMFLQREIEMKEGVQFFWDATQKRKEKQRKKRLREKAAWRAVLTL